MISLLKFYNIVIPPNKLIIQASDTSGKSKNLEHDYPIGYSYNYLLLSKKERNLIQIGNHEKLLLCCFSTDTDWVRRGNMLVNRKIIHNNLLKNGINNLKLKFEDYIINLSKFKFVISPEGNGEDCHRHYEALVSGCIPIIEYNEEILKKYNGLPVLYTKDYSEITPEYLIKMYSVIIKNKFNFSKLFVDYYNIKDREEIKSKGNFWCKKIIEKKPYN